MEIDLGIMAKPIEEQLRENGYRFKNPESAERHKKLIHGWNMVRIHGIATDSEADKMATRLIKKLEKDIEEA